MPRLDPIALSIAALLTALPAGADTPVGLPFRIVESTPLIEPVVPVVARAPDGRFTVAFLSKGDLMARRLAADGTPLGPVFRVGGLGDPGRVTAYDIAIDADGDTVIVWRFVDVASGDASIMVRRYAADGAALGDPAVVDTGAGADGNLYGTPTVATDADGDFVIGWSRAALSDPLRLRGIGSSSTTLMLGQREVRLRRYDRGGVALGDVQRVAIRPDLVLEGPSFGRGFPFAGIFASLGLADTVDVAMDADGDHVVVWGGGNGLGAYVLLPLYPYPGVQTTGIFAKRYDARGVSRDVVPTQVDAAVQFSVLFGEPPLGSVNSAPQVAMQPDGGHAVSWMRRQRAGENSADVLQVQPFTAQGGRLPRLALNLPRSPFRPLRPMAITAAGAGSYVLAWEDSDDFRAARVAVPGRGDGGGAFGTPFVVTGREQGLDFLSGPPTVATDAAGQPVFIFRGVDIARQQSGIYARRYQRP